MTNGDFDANAAAYTVWPGYNGIGGAGNNPSIAGWNNGSGINGTATSLPSSPFQPNINAPHYAFIQGAGNLSQTLNLTPGQTYLFSFEAASRYNAAVDGTPSGLQVYANNTFGTPNLQLNGNVVGSWWLDHDRFQKYSFAFTADTSTQTIQFNGVGIGDHTSNIDKVSITPIASTINVPGGTTFFTNTSGTIASGFYLTGDPVILFQRAGNRTYTGNITTDASVGTFNLHTAGANAGPSTITFSGGTITLGNRVLSVRGDVANNIGGVSNPNGGGINSLADANNQMNVFHNVSLATANNILVSRGALKFSGSSNVYTAGGIAQHGAGSDWAWGSLIIQDTATVYATGGVEFNNVGANLAFNGGTLTTPSIWGNNYAAGGTRTIFNGTRIVATQSNPDFLKVSVDFNESATNGTAHLGNGGGIFDTQAFDVNISSPLADLPGNSGKLQKLGTGTLSLGGVNTYSGGTTVSNGKLRAYTANALGSGAVTVESGGSLLLWWNTGSATISNNFVLNGPGSPSLVGSGTKGAIYADGGLPGGYAEYTISGSITLATDSSIGTHSNNNLRVTGQITGPGGLTKGADRADENGVLILANPANNYAGNTTINKGTIRLAANEVIPHGAGFGNVSVSSGTTLDLAGFSETINGLSGGGNVTLGGGALTVGAANASSSFAGTISGAGTLTKAGGGTFTTAGVISHTGSTAVNEGRLVFQDNVPANRNLSVNSGAILEFNVSSGSRQLNGGAITGSGTFVKSGSGQLWLGANGSPQGIALSDGLIDVQGGLLRNEYHNTGAWDTNKADLNVSSGAYFDLWDAHVTVDAISGSGVINKALNGNHTLTVGANNGSGVFSGSISNAADPSNGSYNYGGIGGGTLNLVKVGSGTQTLSGPASYTGTTTISDGRLVINGDHGAATGAVIVSDGAILGGSGTIGGATTIEAGGIHAPGNSPGIQTFAGDLTYDSNSIFEWDLASSATGVRGTGYDGVNVGGTLSGSDAVFRIVLNSGSFADSFWDADRQWSDIFLNGGNPLGMAGIFGKFEYWEGGNNLTASVVEFQGQFSISGSTLTWNAVPEPTGAVVGILLGAGVLRRRRS